MSHLRAETAKLRAAGGPKSVLPRDPEEKIRAIVLLLMQRLRQEKLGPENILSHLNGTREEFDGFIEFAVWGFPLEELTETETTRQRINKELIVVFEELEHEDLQDVPFLRLLRHHLAVRLSEPFPCLPEVRLAPFLTEGTSTPTTTETQIGKREATVTTTPKIITPNTGTTPWVALTPEEVATYDLDKRKEHIDKVLLEGRYGELLLESNPATEDNAVLANAFRVEDNAVLEQMKAVLPSIASLSTDANHRTRYERLFAIVEEALKPVARPTIPTGSKPDWRSCSSCGTENLPSAIFCTGCGHNLGKEAVAMNEPVTSVAPPALDDKPAGTVTIRPPPGAPQTVVAPGGAPPAVPSAPPANPADSFPPQTPLSQEKRPVPPPPPLPGDFATAPPSVVTKNDDEGPSMDEVVTRLRTRPLPQPEPLQGPGAPLAGGGSAILSPSFAPPAPRIPYMPAPAPAEPSYIVLPINKSRAPRWLAVLAAILTLVWAAWYFQNYISWRGLVLFGINLLFLLPTAFIAQRWWKRGKRRKAIVFVGAEITIVGLTTWYFQFVFYMMLGLN